MSLEERREYLERCDRCNNCKWVPGITSARAASACPSIDYGRFHSFSGAGKTMIALAMAQGRLGEPTEELMRGVYACSACGACDTACKWHHQDLVNPLDTIHSLRHQLVEQGTSPAAHRQAIEHIREHGNRYGQPASARFEWAKRLDLPDARKGQYPVLVHIGCENAFDASQHTELRAIITVLRKAGVDFGVLYDAEVDCGGYAFDTGYQDDAKASASRLVEAIQATKARRLITCSAAAYSAFRYVYPRLGVNLDGLATEHVASTIDRLITQGSLTLPQTAGSGAVTYHDSCKLGRLSEPYPVWTGRRAVTNQIEHTEPTRPVLYGNDGIYDAPRRLIAATGGRLVEMPRNKQFAYCCGALGGGKEAYPEFARHAARERLLEAEQSGAATLVTACGACTSHLQAVAQAEGLAISVSGLFSHLQATTSASGAQ